MSCGACNCEECEQDKAHDRAMNRSNDCQDEYERPAPIQRFYWSEVEPANEVQAKAWMGYINEVFAQYPNTAINMPAMLNMVAQKIPGLRAENYPKVIAQVQRLIHESPEMEIRKGKNGGVFRKVDDEERKLRRDQIQAAIAKKELEYMTLHPMQNVPDLITGKMEDNHTCGCGNTKCNKTEKSCWKCGAPIT